MSTITASVLWVEEVLRQRTVIVVNNGEAGAWSVGEAATVGRITMRYAAICGCLCSVNMLLSPEHDYVDVVPDDSLHAVNPLEEMPPKTRSDGNRRPCPRSSARSCRGLLCSRC